MDDVLKTAQHEAGVYTVIYDVYLPSAVVVILLLFCMVGLAHLGYQKYARWALVLLEAAVLWIIFGSIISYFLARRDTQLVCRKLEEIAREEKMKLDACRLAVAKLANAQETAETEGHRLEYQEKIILSSRRLHRAKTALLQILRP